jgi:membrane protein implicated in regulation of membrane protease activity
MDEDELWRKRLIQYSLVRGLGLLIFFLGLAIIYTNLVRPGGWPRLGAIVAIIGALDALLLPRFVRRAWDKKDRANP